MDELKTPNFYHVFLESRKTILEMMESRGYNTAPYAIINPHDLVKLAINPEALEMRMTHKEDNTRIATILYKEKNIKNNLHTIIDGYIGNLSSDEMTPNSEIIYISYFPVVDTFHQASVSAWAKAKLRIQFFYIKHLVSNPIKHTLQPHFEVVKQENYETIMKEHYVRNKTQFPVIKYHEDMIARYMGLVPGELVKITRPSPSAGEYISYRICA